MPALAEAALGRDSVVAFHPLARRDDGDETVIGRSDADVFVAVPAIGAEAVELLGAGLPIKAAEERLEAATGERVDLLDLAAALVECGLVASIDGRPVPGPPPMRSTLPRLRTEQVRWLLRQPVSLALDLALAAVVVAAIAAAVASGVPLLDFRSLLWSEHGSAVLLAQAAIGWSLILIHETAHLVTARAAGVPGRIGFGTRLQFLVAQTNVTAVWAAPRRHRIAVYSAGMKSDALIAAAAVLVSTQLEPGETAYRLALVVAIVGMTALGLQTLFFMRTDVYFIVQDLARCRNLYGDSGAYARHLASRLRGRRGGHPLAGLGARERRTVQAYTALLVAGTAICLAYAAIVYLPYEIALIGDAVAALRSGSPAGFADGFAVLALLGAVLTIWGRTWWARHGDRVRRAWSARRPRRDDGALQAQ
jgi:putative peptide zinc metalloprotease protein